MKKVFALSAFSFFIFCFFSLAFLYNTNHPINWATAYWKYRFEVFEFDKFQGVLSHSLKINNLKIKWAKKKTDQLKLLYLDLQYSHFPLVPQFKVIEITRFKLNSLYLRFSEWKKSFEDLIKEVIQQKKSITLKNVNLNNMTFINGPYFSEFKIKELSIKQLDYTANEILAIQNLKFESDFINISIYDEIFNLQEIKKNFFGEFSNVLLKTPQNIPFELHLNFSKKTSYLDISLLSFNNHLQINKRNDDPWMINLTQLNPSDYWSNQSKDITDVNLFAKINLKNIKIEKGSFKIGPDLYMLKESTLDWANLKKQNFFIEFYQHESTVKDNLRKMGKINLFPFWKKGKQIFHIKWLTSKKIIF